MLAAALSSIDAKLGMVVSAQFAVWESSASWPWQRIVLNISGETALPVSAFSELLVTFATEIQKGAQPPEACWITACRAHHFKGNPVPPPMPGRLGRAVPLSGYAKLVQETGSTPLTVSQVEDLIRKVVLAGATPNPREFRILQRATLGRFVIWATFNAHRPDTNPFDSMPRSTDTVRTALGLGECPETETLVLLSYGTAAGSSPAFELFRPTICEAAAYAWYCPHPDASASCGMTQPLAPNNAGLPAQPEVVHREISGGTLALPLYLAV